MRSLINALVVLVAVLILPRVAFAQATIAGVVRDSSGGVLPGVTVEASSPALTEKVRTVVTDGTGQYRIVTLPPGTYVVKFSLAGFTTVQRDEVTVSGSGVIPINAELRVGALAETIVVSGSSPLVDTQTTRRETVINAETINALPMTRNYGGVLYATPGLTVQPGVNNNALMPGMSLFSAHGGISTEGRVFVDGVSVNGPFGQNSVTQFAFDVANAQEMQVLVGGGLGESETGGPIANIIPKSGGNTYSGSAFFSGTQSSLQTDNITDTLRAQGIPNGAHRSEELGRQRRSRRTDRPRSALVLHECPNRRHCAGRRRRLGAESLSGRPDQVALRTHTGSRNALHRIEAGFLGAADEPGDATQSGDVLVSAAVPLPRIDADDQRGRLPRPRQRLDRRPGRFGNHRPGGGVRVPECSGQPDAGHVDVSSVQPSPRRCRGLAFLVRHHRQRECAARCAAGHDRCDGKLRDVRASQCFLSSSLRVGRIRHRLVELARGMVVCDRRPWLQAWLSGHAHAVQLAVAHESGPDAIHVQRRRADVGQLHRHVAMGQCQ